MVVNEIDYELEKAEESAERHYPTTHTTNNQHNIASEAEGLAASRQKNNGPVRRTLSREDTVILDNKLSRRGTNDDMPNDVARIATARDLENGEDAERVRTMLTRHYTHETIHSYTIGDLEKKPTALRDLPDFGANKPYPPDLPDKNDYVVDFTGFDDPLHPQNWPTKKKLVVSVVLALTSSFSAWGSSIFSPAIPFFAQHFHISREVATLGISFYILGFATGPLFWGPMSELYGRRLPILISVFGFTIFNIAVAVSKDVQTLMISRLFAGLFAAAPLAVVGAAYADIWDNEHRGNAITLFSLTVSLPALLAPIIGGFIVNSSIHWRWTEYITAIASGSCLVLCFIFFEETYAPVVLVDKAKQLRRATKNWGIHAKQEEIEISFKELVSKNLSRPLKILFTEPIVFFISLYVAFVYGMLYLLLSAYPIVFIYGYHMKGGVAYLPFLGLCLGQLLGGIIVLLFEPRYNRLMKANKGIPIPENRLPPAMIGAVIFPIGLFWFSWSGNYPEHVHWIVPTLSGIFTGAGILLVFLQCLNYIIDAYLMFAASAIAANAFLRSLFGAVFPLFATQLFTALKVGWAGSLLAFIALALTPMPFIFYKYGKQIRSKSKYAPTFGPDGQMIRNN